MSYFTNDKTRPIVCLNSGAILGYVPSSYKKADVVSFIKDTPAISDLNEGDILYLSCSSPTWYVYYAEKVVYKEGEIEYSEFVKYFHFN